MYKFYRKDRNQWVEVATFENWGRARYYANRMKYVIVANPKEQDNYYYRDDCYALDMGYLKEELTEEQLEDLREGSDYEMFADKYGIAICRECGEIFALNSTDYQNVDGNYYCCDECLHNGGYIWCDDCQEYVESDEYITHDGRTICECCRDNHYYICESCGDLFHEDEVHWDDDGDYCYCDNCWDDYERENGIIMDYHSGCRPEIEIQRTEEDKPYDLTVGTEIETECKGSYKRSEVAEEINKIVNQDKELFFFERDGSLSDQGYETISQPFTMRWFQKNKDLFEKMFSKMIDMGCRSHDTTTCGFHVHFGRHFFGNEEHECIDRLVYLFEKYRHQLEIFSRRKSFNWCEFPSIKYEKSWEHQPVDWSKLADVKKISKSPFNGHGSAVNLENRNTIEIRIFRGTLNFSTYCATLELVNNLVTYVRDKSDEDVEKGSFTDIINYLPTEHLKQYCLDRNII